MGRTSLWIDPVIAVWPRVNGKQRQRALPHAEVAEALRTARLARWPEMDMKTRTWTVPGQRTKSGRPHRVALSKGALAVLGEARQLWGAKGLVLPSVTGRGLSDSTISKMFRELPVNCVPHGMRSSFRDWAGETVCPGSVRAGTKPRCARGWGQLRPN